MFLSIYVPYLFLFYSTSDILEVEKLKYGGGANVSGYVIKTEGANVSYVEPCPTYTFPVFHFMKYVLHH
jgi:hypothetical protein